MVPTPSPSSATPAIDPQDAQRFAQAARLGVRMLLVYLVLYGGFIAVSVLAPQVLAAPVLLGVNVAVLWGLGLIVTAVVMALLYLYLARDAA